MTTRQRRSREDVVAAAGRLFAERGYHGTSMRDLGEELGLLGSSLYSHVGGKEELLVEVIRRGAATFQALVDEVLAGGIKTGDFRSALDVPLAAIAVLSILNSVSRWYRPAGPKTPEELARGLFQFILRGVT